MTPGSARTASSDVLGRPEDLDLHDVALGHARLQLGRRAAGHDLAARDDRDPVAELVGLEHVVRREEHRRAGGDEGGDGLPELAGADRVDADARLVEEEDLGLVQQAARDVQPLPHAARVALDPLPLAPVELHQLEELTDPGALLAGGHGVELGEVLQVVQRREPLVEPAVAAEDVADLLAHRSRVGDDVVAEDASLPAVGSRSVMSILIVVVLPAPFGPSSPKSSPRSTSKLMPLTAWTSLVDRRLMPVFAR